MGVGAAPAPRGTRKPSATKTRHRRPSRACCRTATPSLILPSARLLNDETLCKAEAGPVVRLLSWALRSRFASSACTRDGAERDVDNPALHGQVCTAVVPLENLG